MRFQTLFTLFATATLALGINIPRQASTAPTPHQPHIIATCTSYYKVVSGDTCYKIVISNGNFTLDDFYQWNPDVGADCSALPLGFYVCINGGTKSPPPTSTGTTATPTSTCPPQPTPTQQGTISCCKAFYKVVDGDTCAGLENRFRISDATFRKWNTGIDTNCYNLQKDFYVCVGA